MNAGGVFPILVGGRVNGKSAPVQKHPQPEGHSRPDPSQEFQQEICVTWAQVVHVLDKPR